jgi:hypothetical protein
MSFSMTIRLPAFVPPVDKVIPGPGAGGWMMVVLPAPDSFNCRGMITFSAYVPEATLISLQVASFTADWIVGYEPDGTAQVTAQDVPTPMARTTASPADALNVLSNFIWVSLFWLGIAEGLHERRGG